MIYNAPLTRNNTPYWVPIVIKNRDTLVGYLEGVIGAVMNYDVPIGSLIESLSSERFNDISRTDSGKRLGKMTNDELYDYFYDIISRAHEEISHPEQEEGLLKEYEFGVTCACGNWYGFHSVNDIPEEKIVCQLCDKLVIDYINVDDDYYGFDGNAIDDQKLQKIIDSIHLELGIDNDPEPNEF